MNSNIPNIFGLVLDDCHIEQIWRIPYSEEA